jgi:hypothetical protein
VKTLLFDGVRQRLHLQALHAAEQSVLIYHHPSGGDGKKGSKRCRQPEEHCACVEPAAAAQEAALTMHGRTESARETRLEKGDSLQAEG